MKQRTGSNSLANHLLFQPTQRSVCCYPDPYRRQPFHHGRLIYWAPNVQHPTTHA